MTRIFPRVSARDVFEVAKVRDLSRETLWFRARQVNGGMKAIIGVGEKLDICQNWTYKYPEPKCPRSPLISGAANSVPSKSSSSICA